MIVLPSTIHDVCHVAQNLRGSDQIETFIASQWAGRDHNVERDLIAGFNKHEYWTWWYEGEIVGVGGVARASVCEDIGACWFLGTKRADEHVIGLLRSCRRFLRSEAKNWYAFGNIIPKALDRRLAWVRNLGFDFQEREAHQNGQEVVVFMTQPLSTARQTALRS